MVWFLNPYVEAVYLVDMEPVVGMVVLYSVSVYIISLLHFIISNTLSMTVKII